MSFEDALTLVHHPDPEYLRAFLELDQQRREQAIMERQAGAASQFLKDQRA